MKCSDPLGKSRPKQGGFKKILHGETFLKSEEMVIRLMIHHPEMIPALSKEDVVKEFESPILQKLAEALEDLYLRKESLTCPRLSPILGRSQGEIV